jgi:tetratricopeptide (TPR) repeat protein
MDRLDMPALNRAFASLTAQSHRHVGNRWSLYAIRPAAGRRLQVTRRRAKGKKPDKDGVKHIRPSTEGDSRAMMERTMAGLSKFISSREFDSVEQLNAAIGQEFLGPVKIADEPRLASPLDRAQNLVWDAWEKPQKRERIRMAEEALQLSADCADAYVLLAEEKARTAAESKALYEEAVRAGARALGQAVFEEDVGHFWGLLKTRPYMRARAGLADVLWRLRQFEDAITNYRELLRLNPNDNQGIRYRLLSSLLAQHMFSEAEELLDQHDDASSAWLYARALVDLHKHGRGKKSDESLQDAIHQNPHVPQFLLGEKRLPKRMPEYIGWGDEAEAVAYAASNLELWHSTAGAMSWLKSKLG